MSNTVAGRLIKSNTTIARHHETRRQRTSSEAQKCDDRGGFVFPLQEPPGCNAPVLVSSVLTASIPTSRVLQRQIAHLLASPRADSSSGDTR